MIKAIVLGYKVGEETLEDAKNKIRCFSLHSYTKLKLQVTPEGRIPLKK